MSYKPGQEKWLLDRARDGDQAAFRNLYDGLFPGVYGYARSRLPSNQIAEDVVADTFMAVLAQFDAFEWRGEGSLRAWVFRILRNHIADHYRQNGHFKSISLSGLEGSAEVGWAVDPEQAHSNLDQKEFLLKAISRLSPRQQEIVQLRYFGGLRNIEIAGLLGISQRAVSAYLSRALAALQGELSIDWEGHYHG